MRRTDDQIACYAEDVALLRAILTGEVVQLRDDRRIVRQYVWTGQDGRSALVRLQRDDLISLPLLGDPVLALRGLRVLELAGELEAKPWWVVDSWETY